VIDAIFTIGVCWAITAGVFCFVFVRLMDLHAAQLSEMASRVQAPESFQMAAIEQVIADRPPKEPTQTWEPIQRDGDLALADFLDRGDFDG